LGGVVHASFEEIPSIAIGVDPPIDEPYRHVENPKLAHIRCSRCKRHEIVDSVRALALKRAVHQHAPTTVREAPTPNIALDLFGSAGRLRT
jgi:hypothetical protein